MYFSSQKEHEELRLLLPMTVDLESFLHLLYQRYDLDITLNTSYNRRPIRLCGKAAEEVRVSVFGSDRQEYMTHLKRELEDYLEASGYIA